MSQNIAPRPSSAAAGTSKGSADKKVPGRDSHSVSKRYV